MKTVHLIVIAMGMATLLSNAIAGDFDLPEPNLKGAKHLSLTATRFYVQPASIVEDGVPILDIDGRPLTKPISRTDWCLGIIEGTIAVNEEGGKVRRFNYVSSKGERQVDCKSVLGPRLKEGAVKNLDASERSRFTEVTAPYGLGKRDYQLVPYRTLAVDKNTMRIGTVVYIPDARGWKLHLPDGTVAFHDGFFFVADGGGNIEANHIDVFCGAQLTVCLPEIIGGRKFDAYEVKDDAAMRKLISAHRPGH